MDNGFGDVSKDVDTWLWGYSGVGSDSGIATGSSNDQAVPAGKYNVEEDLAAMPNYHFTSVSCTGDLNDSITDAAKTSVVVKPGEDVICTYKNTRDTAHITVTKQVINDNGGTANVSDFELFVNQTKVTSGDMGNPDRYEYSISENMLADGYKQTSLTCWLTSDPFMQDIS